MPGGFTLGMEPTPWKRERIKSPGGEKFLRPLPPGEEIHPELVSYDTGNNVAINILDYVHVYVVYYL